MRTTLVAMAVGAVLLVGADANAQFANRSLGLGVGYMRLNAGDVEPINSAVPVTLEATFYIENHFDLYVRVPFMFMYSPVGVGPAGGAGIVVGTGGQFGIRYLFLEESLRPYVGLHLAGLYIFRDPATIFGGVGAGVGVDYFASDSVSIGARGYFDLFLTLNQPLWTGIGGALNVSVYF